MNKSSLLAAMLALISTVISGNLYASQAVELKLPDSASITFQPVFLGLDGDDIFSSRTIKMGSREGVDGGYKERLSTTNLGGSFVARNKSGQNEWLYYLGRTEVSVKQWNSVMRWWQQKNGLKVEQVNNSPLPQTSKTPAEIFTFIEALNVYLLQNQKAALPRNGNAVAYVRLPTEVEWAFAARGGNEVSPSVFDRPYPYVDENGSMSLAGYEWHRRTSGNKLKEAGSQYLKPNPLGIYDMLGNAEELTYGIFGHDFLFARYGGLVVRGASYGHDSSDLKVSRRAEYQGYKTNSGEILRWPKVGFRLALATLVSETGVTPDELDDGYDDYLSSESGVSQAAPAGNTSLSKQAQDDQINHYINEIDRLTGELKTLRTQNMTLESEFSVLQGSVEQQSIDLGALQRALEAERAKSNNLSRLADSNSSEQKYNVLIETKDTEIARLQSELSQLVRQVSEQSAKIKSAELKQKQVVSLKQQVDDAERRGSTANFEIEKNKKRIVVAEKRLLEALVRVAGYNLFTAWRNLKAIEIKKKAGNSINPKVWATNKREAENMLKEYRRYVIQIVDNTDHNLFPEVKSEIIRWLRASNISEQQIKGMDLLERHITEVQQGKYMQVDYLFENLLTEPEMK